MKTLIDHLEFLTKDDIEVLVSDFDKQRFFDRAMMSLDYIFVNDIERKLYAKELYNYIVNFNPQGIGNDFVFGILVYFQFKGDLSGYDVKRMIQTKWS